MIVADFHVHSTFSVDGISTMEQHCIAAIQKGIKKICFTEHVDYNIAEYNVGKVKDNRKQNFDIKEYFKFSNRNTVKKPNRALNCVWATTNDITDDCTFIIGKETWKFVDDDRISIPGVSYSTLNYIGIDESQDSVDE